MALAGTGNTLGSAIKTAVDGLDLDDFKNDPDAARLAVFQAIGTAIITHLTVTAGTAAVGGVTTGAGFGNIV